MQIAILYRSCGKYCPVWNAGEFFPMPYPLIFQVIYFSNNLILNSSRVVVFQENNTITRRKFSTAFFTLKAGATAQLATLFTGFTYRRPAHERMRPPSVQCV